MNRRDAACFSGTILTLELIFLIIFLQSLASTIFLKVISFLAIGILQYRLVIAVHETAHLSFYSSKKVNQSMGKFLSSLLMIDFNNYQKSHWLHHRSKEANEDPDAYIYQPILQAKTGLQRALVFTFGSVREIFRKITLKSLLYKPNSRGGIGNMPTDKFYILFAQIILFSYFLYFQKPINYIFLWILPLATVALMLNRIRVLVEHAGSSSLDASYTLLPSANIKSNFLERLIISPYNFNYHLEHHRRPSLHYKELPKNISLGNSRSKKEMLRTTYFHLLMRILFTLR